MRTKADREASKRWKKNHPEKVSAWNSGYRKRNKSKIASYQREWLKKHPGYMNKFKRREKEAKAKRIYTNICDICGIKNKSKIHHAYDHCHKTGNFRGWLCNRCNTTLGRVNDDPELLRKMASYLEKHT